MQTYLLSVRNSAVLAIAFCIGCGAKTETSINTVSNAVSQGATASEPTAANTNGLTGNSTATQPNVAPKGPKGQSIQFDHFAFSLPDRFKLEREADQNDMKIAVYHSKSNEKETQAVISMTLIRDERAAAEMSKNERQFLVNFSAGNANSLGIKVMNRSKHEPFEWNGLRGTQMKLLLKLANQQDAAGIIYGLIHDKKVLIVMHVLFEGDPSIEMKEVEDHLATMKAQ